MKSAITAFGTANPKYMRQQTDAAAQVSSGLNLTPVENRILKSIYKATGIQKRYSVISDYCKKDSESESDFFPKDPEALFPSTAKRMQVYKDNALPLAIEAINNCLTNQENISINDITHLITVSCTGMYAPGIDIEIVQTLKLNTRVKRTAINFMGCYGAFNGIKVADAICKADANAKVLLVCIELCTIHFQKEKSLSAMVSNALFADGAAAILIEHNSQNKKSLSLESFHCDLLPQSSNEMAWRIADFGFDIVLSSYVPEMIQSGIADFTNTLFKQSTYDIADIDFYAIHPGGLKILQACEAALNISPEKNKYSYDVLSNYGNMSSPTVLFVLKAIWDDLTENDNDKTIFSCAFGPGLTLEAMLLKTKI